MSPTKLILLSLIGYCIGTTPLQTPDGNVISGNGRMVFSDEEYDRSRVTAPEQLPTVKLPYGTYRANSYDSSRDVWQLFPMTTLLRTHLTRIVWGDGQQNENVNFLLASKAGSGGLRHHETGKLCALCFLTY